MKKQWIRIPMKNKVAAIAIICFLISCSGQIGKYRTKIVYIESEKVVISANIYKPEGNGPFPAVVMVHGSKNHTMDYYTEYSEYFASHGIVAVNYDKRGQGRSTGSLYTSTFTDLAKDALSIVDYLKNQPYVDTKKIGLWADSQAGWVILIADSLTNDLAFMINKAGPAMTPMEQILYDYKTNYMLPNKTPSTVMEELGVWYENVFNYLTRSRTDSLWYEVKSVIEKYEDTRFLKADFDKYYLSILGPPDSIKSIHDVILDPGGRAYDFDPIPYLKRLKTPMIYFIGAADKLNNTPACIDAIKKVDNPNIVLKVYKNADHGIRIQRGPALFFKPSFPDGYLQLQEDFIFAETSMRQ